MHTCNKCKGTGKLTIPVTEHLKGGVVNKSEFTMDCLYCHGKGKITEDRKRQLAAQDAIWCKCGNPSHSSSYHPDYMGMKHHWTCDDCGKVTQIG